ncbi:amino acid synthesis family protein [Brevibacillus massiliensis]|jgi:hypothetical protein|uniref:amino acid synthesis family protein n=1 Tax=Brevibacillus massiliensis TaxID=1118054 RepID=UPI0002EFC8A0|nr:amino acid synthesis family protein [Brevibacillus massiliensis]
MEIRKMVTTVEETYIEGFKQVEKPVRVAVAAAVIQNPYAGKYVEDLQPLIDEYSAKLGKLLPSKALEALGLSGEECEGYGKAALVGLDGEVEHGSAIIHTMLFGNEFRKVCGNAKTLLPSAEKRGGAGASIDLAIKHKMDAKIRSHHMSFEFRIPDAPRADEIVIAAAVTSSGRAHPRIGSLHAELAAQGEQQE